MDKNQNPFSALLQQFQGQGQMPQGQQMPLNGQVTQQGGQMMGEKMPPNQLERGTVTGTTGYLNTAISSIQNAIRESQDRDTIATLRSIVLLLSRLIGEDQQVETGNLS